MIDKYKQLIEFSLEWNEKINITAISDPEEFLKKNILDSLEITQFNEFNNAEKILDLGTGGGYPGLPLAMNYPKKCFTLVDSVGKKLMVIDDICSRLSISNVKTIHGRAEDLARDKKFRDSFDLVVSRAVAAMPTLIELALPFVKPGGYFAAYKTKTSLKEIDEASAAIKKLGGKVSKIEHSPVDNSDHILVFVEKLVETPRVFPRKSGEAKRNPLK